MKVLFIAAIAAMFFSCSSKIYPVKGTYPKTPMEISTDKSFDQAWDKLVDMFAQKGISIKIIDRSSGLIVSDKTVLQATTEDANGKVLEPRALIVVPTIKINGRLQPINGTTSGPYAKVLNPNPVYGDWNVRIKKSATGCTINVNIVNVFYYDKVVAGFTQIQEIRSVTDFKSTGIFENEIADYIK